MKNQKWTLAEKDAYLFEVCAKASRDLSEGNWKDEDEEDYLLFHGVHLSIAKTEERLTNLGVVLPWAKKNQPKKNKHKNQPKARRSSRRRSARATKNRLSPRRRSNRVKKVLSKAST